MPPGEEDKYFYSLLLWGTDWESTLEGATIEKVAKNSATAFQKSGVPSFLKVFFKNIYTSQLFLQEVVHTALATASNKCSQFVIRKIKTSATQMKKRAEIKSKLMKLDDDIRNSTATQRNLDLISHTITHCKFDVQCIFLVFHNVKV